MGTAQVMGASRPEVGSQLTTHSAVPPEVHVGDAETDITVLRSIPHQFSIVDEKSANWLVRRVQNARQYAQRVKDWAEEEVRRAEREEKTLLYLYGRQIEAWAKGEIENLKGRRKSINLPAGVVGYRSIGPRLVIDDEAVVLAWAKHHLPDAVIVTERLSKAVVNDHAEKLGVIPDEGVHVESAVEKFFIR